MATPVIKTVAQAIEDITGIEIDKMGPIDRTMIPLPVGGGVTELVGSNGVGKSTALRCCSAVISGKGSHGLTPNKDDSLDPTGHISYGEVKVTVRHSVRHRGSAEVCHLEGKLDLETFVDPGLQDVEKNDYRRIKALIALTGVKANVEELSYLVGGDEAFESIASAKTIAAADLISMVSSFKRDLQVKARSLEDDGNKAEGKATALQASIAGVDLEGPHDGDALSKRHIQASETGRRLIAEKRAAYEADERATGAKDRLDKISAQYDGLTVEQLKVRLTESQSNLEKCKAEAAEIDQRIMQGEADARLLSNQITSTAAHFRTVNECREAIEATRPTAPENHVVAQAAEEVESAAKAMIEGGKIREAIKAKKLSTEWRGVCEKSRKQAERLREAAKATDDVLAASIHSDVLRVHNGRLAVTHPRRGQDAFFQDLSDGERWRIAIDLAIETLNRNGVGSQRILQISQHAWEGLDPTNRKAIHDHAIVKSVNIVTALADNGPLRARVFSDRTGKVE